MDLISRRAALSTVEKMYKLCEGNLSDYHDLLVACFTDFFYTAKITRPIRTPEGVQS